MVETSVLVSALAGAGSFFSPCILPIVPAFVSYLSGTTLSEVQNQDKSSEGQSQVTVKRMTRLNIFLNTVYFVLGFSLVFAVLGVIFNSVLVNAGTGFQGTLQWIGGIVIVGFGAYLILSTKFRQLNFEKRMTNLPRFKTTYLTSFVFGAAFASGWTPCVGPILGSTLTLAATSPGAAYNSLLAYALGLGVPFLITGVFFSQATGIIRKMVKHLKYFNPIMGAVLIVLGILVFTNQLSLIASFPLTENIINLERGI
ncbi:cytochrome c biogenesis CcdA family protein [Nitrososphaera sp.]|uniref:cytochrome c biogenesis CcdA family protein n=1 Tax=Nitrososphaera sp. TaxID=1971748 RepID=UPI002ED8B5DC